MQVRLLCDLTVQILNQLKAEPEASVNDLPAAPAPPAACLALALGQAA